MVILGPEPVIVDTGTIANRDRWRKDAFSPRCPVSRDSTQIVAATSQPQTGRPLRQIADRWR
jgi:hypothetical protein